MKNNNTYQNLDSFDKKNPFKTPEGYFDSFEEKMMQSIQKEVPSKPKVVQMMRPYLYIAAGFLLILTIGNMVLKPFADLGNQQLATHTIIVDEELEFMLSQTDDYSLIDFFIEEEVSWIDETEITEIE